MSLHRVAALAALLGFACSAHAITADELIAKNLEARGGIDKIKAIKSVRFEGKMDFGGGNFVLAMIAVQKRPSFLRTEASLQGLTAIQAYDGTDAWQIQPFGGRKDPERLSADDAKDLIEEADLDGPLVDYKAKGNTVEYLGTEDVDGTEAHKLKLTRANKTVQYIYFDPDYFLQIRVVTQRMVRGAQVESESDLGNYEQVAGVWMPFAIDSGSVGSTEKGQKLTFTKAEANVELDDAQFHFPAGAAK